MSKIGFTEGSSTTNITTVFTSNVSNVQNWDGGGDLDTLYNFGEQSLNVVLTVLSYYVNSTIENTEQIVYFANGLNEV